MPLKNKAEDEVPATGTKRRYSEKDSDEYRAKRDRNNVAVKKSRERSRQKAKETTDRVSKLKKENEDLEMKVKVLSKELSLLKDLFLSHAGSVTEINPAKPTGGPVFPVKTDPGELNSHGESDDSSDGAGPFANAEAIQKDHEYSAAPMFVLASNQ